MKTTMGDVSRYVGSLDHSTIPERLILPTPPTRRSASSVGSVSGSKSLDRKSDSGLERWRVPLKMGLCQSYITGKDSGSTSLELEDDFTKQTCPPGEIGRYLRQQHSSTEPPLAGRLPKTRPAKHPPVRQLAQDEDNSSMSSWEFRGGANKLSHKKPEKQPKKSQEQSGKLAVLIQEQLQLEKELNELEQIREQLVPPLYLQSLTSSNQADDDSSLKASNGEQSHRSVVEFTLYSGIQKDHIPKRRGISSALDAGLNLPVSGPSSATAGLEVTSGDSTDREVEGLLSELLFPEQNYDDTSPLLYDGVLEEKMKFSDQNEVKVSSRTRMSNGFHKPNNFPSIANEMMHNYSTPPKPLAHFGAGLVPAQTNQTRASSFSHEKVRQFVSLKKHELYWKNQIGNRRRILEQKLDTVARLGVEEQYFYSQGELSKIEKAIADLFQCLSPVDVQWLTRNGVTQTTCFPSQPKLLSPVFGQPSHQRHYFDITQGPSGKGLSVPREFGYNQSIPQTQSTTNSIPSGEPGRGPNYGMTFIGLQDTDNISAVFSRNPPCSNKETQTVNGFQGGLNSASGINHTFAKQHEFLNQVLVTRQPQGPVGKVEVVDPKGHSGDRASEARKEEIGEDISVAQFSHGERWRVNPHSSVRGKPQQTPVKQLSFDDQEVVRLKEKLGLEQSELQETLEKEKILFLEEQRRLKEEEVEQLNWMRQRREMERQNAGRTCQTIVSEGMQTDRASERREAGPKVSRLVTALKKNYH